MILFLQCMEACLMAGLSAVCLLVQVLTAAHLHRSWHRILSSMLSMTGRLSWSGQLP